MVITVIQSVDYIILDLWKEICFVEKVLWETHVAAVFLSIKARLTLLYSLLKSVIALIQNFGTREKQTCFFAWRGVFIVQIVLLCLIKYFISTQ